MLGMKLNRHQSVILFFVDILQFSGRRQHYSKMTLLIRADVRCFPQ
jgi:hypothetical protein